MADRTTRLTLDEARRLYLEAPTAELGRMANDVRRRKHPEGVVTYIIDRNVNYTNVCVARCRFCAFYRPVGSSEGYTLGFDEIFKKIDETIALGGVQLLLQGGHNPDVPIEWYENLFRQVKARYPDFRLHALSPPEVIHLTRMSRLPVSDVLDRLIAATGSWFSRDRWMTSGGESACSLNDGYRSLTARNRSSYHVSGRSGL